MSVEIIQGDCREELARFEGAADLVLTSPPYGSLREYGGHGFDWRGVIDAIVPTLKPGGVCVWVVMDETVDGDESGDSFRQALRFQEAGLLLHDTMIYHKRTRGGGKTWPGRHQAAFEFMFVVSNGRPATFNPIVDVRAATAGAWTRSKTMRNRAGDFTRGSSTWQTPDFLPRDNVWSYSTGGQVDPVLRRHPAPFPYKLAADHVRTWTNPGDLVLDPMAGSGTTLRAALDLERETVGIEIEPRYVEIIRQRTAQRGFALTEAT